MNEIEIDLITECKESARGELDYYLSDNIHHGLVICWWAEKYLHFVGPLHHWFQWLGFDGKAARKTAIVFKTSQYEKRSHTSYNLQPHVWFTYIIQSSRTGLRIITLSNKTLYSNWIPRSNWRKMVPWLRQVNLVMMQAQSHHLPAFEVFCTTSDFIIGAALISKWSEVKPDHNTLGDLRRQEEDDEIAKSELVGFVIEFMADLSRRVLLDQESNTLN